MLFTVAAIFVLRFNDSLFKFGVDDISVEMGADCLLADCIDEHLTSRYIY